MSTSWRGTRGRVLLLLLVFCLLAMAARFVYMHAGPDLPFSGRTASEVKALLNGYDGKLIKLATVDGVDWYGAPSGPGAGAEAMKREMVASGWRFVQQEGAGYFFVRGVEKIVVTSEMWTGRYVLFRIPTNTL